MVTRLLTLVSQFILSVISAGGYAGVFLLTAIGSACVPLPSEVVMSFAGYLVGQGRFNLWAVGLTGGLGCTAGSAVAYAIGSRGGRPFLERYGRYLLIRRRELAWADDWFARYGPATVFFAQMMPGIRSFIALPAGIGRMNFGRLLVYTFLGAFPWCLGLAYLGLKFGEKWDQTIRPYFEKFDLLLGLLLLLAVIGFVVSRWRELRAPAPPR